jgi:hypothetical protein
VETLKGGLGAGAAPRRMTLMRGSHLSAAVYGGRDFLLGAILIYGYVYTAYKYGNPLFGRNDFFRYEEIVSRPFDFSVTPAPFALRQIPAVVAAAFYRLGLYWQTMAAIDSVGVDEETKRRFFAMILSNAFAVCLSFTVLSGYLRTKLATDSIINSLALFGIFSGWFYFSSAVIAPVTIGWGWLASSLLAIAFLERNAPITLAACAIALFSRETTIIFGLLMFLALLLFGRDRSRGVLISILVLVASCCVYLALRIGFTAGYAHQIDPARIVAQLGSLSFPAHFFVQLILAQGVIFLLLLLVGIKQPRYAAYLLMAAAGMSFLALSTNVTDVGVIIGETLPFYAVVFILTWNEALPKQVQAR